MSQSVARGVSRVISIRCLKVLVLAIAGLAVLGIMSTFSSLSTGSTLSAAQLVAQPAQAGAPAAAAPERSGGEVNLVLPDLSSVDFDGINGRTLLMSGLVVCVLGLLFGMWTFTALRNLPVHPSMLE